MRGLGLHLDSPPSLLPPPGRRRAGENYEDEAMASRSKKSWNILKQEGQDKVNQRVFMFLWRRPASTRRRRRWRWCAAATHSTQDQPTQKILAQVQSPRIFHEKSESKIV